jgi:signal transduction histidine kinase/DNA-binding NarL/FixJ family response regulator
VDRAGNIRHLSDTTRRYIGEPHDGAFFDRFLILRPGSISSPEGLFNPPASLFLIRDRSEAFAARGQVVTLRWDGEDMACFCGSPWLFWMDTNRPDTKLGIADFPPQDSQLDQLFLMTTEQRMVSDLEKLNIELQVARRAAEEAQTAKSALFARMSHEMRTPLNGVVSALALLSDVELSEEARRLLQFADTSSRNLLHVINYVLDISKLEAGRTELDPVAFSLAGLFESVTDIVRPRAVEKGLALSWQISPQLNDAYVGDKAKLHQCLLNLVTNAIKFTRRGSVSLRASPAPEGGSGMLRFEIEDTGRGISEEDQQHIFEPFWTGNDDLLPAERGTGLGLDIVRRNVDAMQGRMGLVSRPGKGSIFWMTLPFEAGVEPVEGGEETASRVPARLHGRILLVDDNRTNLLLGRMILESLGLEVEEASDGSAAVSRCSDEDFDLVLMDISMPGMDGIAATGEIRRFAGPEALPILALTAYASSDERERCLQAGMNAYLTKPIVRDHLAENLAQFLRADFDGAGTAVAREEDSPAEPPLDEAVLRTLRQQIGDERLGQVLDRFLGEVDTRWASLAAAWRDRDGDAARREAHTLASTCGSLGLMAAGECFSALETELRAQAPLGDDRLDGANVILRRGLKALGEFREADASRGKSDL